jgi:hypothetical protein
MMDRVVTTSTAATTEALEKVCQNSEFVKELRGA